MPDLVDLAMLRVLVEMHLGSKWNFIFDSENHPITGGRYHIYILENEDKSRRICVRIPVGTAFWLRSRVEARWHYRVDAAGLDLFQPLIAQTAKSSNFLRAPFVILGWADGTPLKWSDTHPAAEGDRKRVLSAVANASLDLLKVSDLGESALRWISRHIKFKQSLGQRMNFPASFITECKDQMNLIRKYWIPELDEAPHVLVHGDLAGKHIIVSDDFIVTGITDLSSAIMTPLQFAAVYPRFLTHEPGVNGRGFTERNTKQMKKDREYYLECIKERAMRQGGIAMKYYHVLSRDDEPRRYWWLTALKRIDVHKAMVACNWEPPIPDLEE